jgi:lysyl-tRNA synthetase class 2
LTSQLENGFLRSKNFSAIEIYSEIKTRQKLREKAEKQAAKDAEKAAKAKAEPKAAARKADEEEKLDPTQYTQNRKNYVQALRDQGKNPYPHKFDRTHRID